jgi:hypothetical protein
LSSLDVSNNQLVSDSDWIDNKQNTYKEGVLVEYQGVQCPVTQRTDSSCYKVLVLHGILALIHAIKDMGSLSKLSFNGGVYGHRGWEEGETVTIDTTMTEADFSGKKLGLAGAQILAAFMSTKLFEAKGSLSSLTFCGNGGDYGFEGDAVTINTTMSASRKEADFCGKKLGAVGAQILAAFMSTKLFQAKGSLVSLNLANNYYSRGYVDGRGSPEFIRPIAAMLKTNTCITELNTSANELNAEAAGVFAEGIEANRSLSKLKMTKYELPVQEIKTATELDLSRKGLSHLDAIVIAALIKVQTIAQNHLVIALNHLVTPCRVTGRWSLSISRIAR